MALQQSGLSGRHFGWAEQINQNSSGLPEIALLHHHTGPKDTKEQEPCRDGEGSAHFCCCDVCNSFGSARARFTVLWVTRCRPASPAQNSQSHRFLLTVILTRTFNQENDCISFQFPPVPYLSLSANQFLLLLPLNQSLSIWFYTNSHIIIIILLFQLKVKVHFLKRFEKGGKSE